MRLMLLPLLLAAAHQPATDTAAGLDIDWRAYVSRADMVSGLASFPEAANPVDSCAPADPKPARCGTRRR